MSIPFETIDVYVGHPITLNIGEIYKKVIDNKRGGYCYELNLLFHNLLTQVGFESNLISASIFNNGQFGPDCDHMAIIVKQNKLWLIDVGYGDLFIEPLLLEPHLPQKDYLKTYCFNVNEYGEFILSESLDDETGFKVKYKFENKPRAVEDFEEQNTWKQSSKESHFVKNKICTIPTKNGRKTIFNNKFKLKIDDKVLEIDIESEKQLREILEKEFFIKF